MKDTDIKWIQQMVGEITDAAQAARTAGKPNYYQPLVASNFPDQELLTNLQSGISAALKAKGFTASEWAALEPGIFSLFIPFSGEEQERALKAGYMFAPTEGIAPPNK